MIEFGGNHFIEMGDVINNKFDDIQDDTMMNNFNGIYYKFRQICHNGIEWYPTHQKEINT